MRLAQPDAESCEYENPSDWLAPVNEWSAKPSLGGASDHERSLQMKRLDSFRSLKRGWDSYDAEPPSEIALANALKVMRCLWCSEITTPIRLSPSVEGGVGIVFSRRAEKYADIECFNDGEILAITSEGTSEPRVWTLVQEPGSIRMAIEKIHFFLNG